MSALASIITVALLAQPQLYRCPPEINYDVAVSGHHLTLVALYDRTECDLRGSTAHCKVVGTSLLHGDTYTMPVTVSKSEVSVNGVICRASNDPVDLTPPTGDFLK